jgi:uncharacterized protein YceK
MKTIIPTVLILLVALAMLTGCSSATQTSFSGEDKPSENTNIEAEDEINNEDTGTDTILQPPALPEE